MKGNVCCSERLKVGCLVFHVSVGFFSREWEEECVLAQENLHELNERVLPGSYQIDEEIIQPYLEV